MADLSNAEPHPPNAAPGPLQHAVHPLIFIYHPGPPPNTNPRTPPLPLLTRLDKAEHLNYMADLLSVPIRTLGNCIFTAVRAGHLNPITGDLRGHVNQHRLAAELERAAWAGHLGEFQLGIGPGVERPASWWTWEQRARGHLAYVFCYKFIRRHRQALRGLNPRSPAPGANSEQPAPGPAPASPYAADWEELRLSREEQKRYEVEHRKLIVELQDLITLREVMEGDQVLTDLMAWQAQMWQEWRVRSAQCDEQLATERAKYDATFAALMTKLDREFGGSEWRPSVEEGWN